MKLGMLVRGSSAVPVLATEVRAALVPNFTTEAAEVAREAHEAAETAYTVAVVPGEAAATAVVPQQAAKVHRQETRHILTSFLVLLVGIALLESKGADNVFEVESRESERIDK